jgi:phosphatidylinositol 4-kinase
LHRSGADLLGPLLPSVAEICSDLDILGVVEPTVLKLFRNLWFYIVLFGLAPPIQKVQVVSKNVSSSAPSVGSMSAVALQAVAGPYLWNTQWSAAVVRITQGTPPLVRCHNTKTILSNLLFPLYNLDPITQL